jgi:molecular chaperone GrpE
MSTKTNDPKQTAPETDPTAEDVKTDTAAPAAETEEAPAKQDGKKADKKETKKEKESKEKESKEKKETKKEIEADLAAEKDKYLRLLAEYDNYRRRSTREREAIYADVRCDTLKKFLPVYDSLSRALTQTPADDPARKGLEGIMNQYNSALNQLGVTAIEAVGQPFDANRHNAVMHIEDDAYGEGVVVEEFEKGFCIGDRVLRYSVVKVAN